MADKLKTYYCGSLTYTRPQLVLLFFWLLWGDFIYNLMEAVTPSIMPLRFQALGASNTAIGLILGTIPAIVYSTLNPIISFRSDRFRSRFGRRIPFILFSIPFIVIGLVCLGFGDRLGFWLHDHIGFVGHRFSPNAVAIMIIGIFMVAFTFFNTFVTSVFWYLFNDVVPQHLLARFLSWFRLISMLSAALYNFCIFRFANTHYVEIQSGAALLYLAGFGLMCLNVKEGTYPPPAAYDSGASGPLAAIKTYGRECHALKHYWYQWVGSFIGAIGGGVGTFGLFFSLAIGLNLAQIGYVNGSISIAVSILIIIAGWLADKYHPFRVVMVGMVFSLLITTPSTLIWLFWHPTPSVAFWVCMAMGIGLVAPTTAMAGMYDPVLLYRLFPRERFGQFCSCNAVWRAVGGIIGGGLAGVFLDIMTRFVGKEQAYFYIPVWQIFFSIPGFYLTFMLYKSWKRYGGDDYVPPLPEYTKVMTTGNPAISNIAIEMET